MTTHFIADLHLQVGHEQPQGILHRYLAGHAREAHALYILGDLFEYWLGDDVSLDEHHATIQALAGLSSAGVKLFFMVGNRDFAVGHAFERACGIRILDDPATIELYGTPTLISHGDLLCTDDVDHQSFRARYTDPAWLAQKRALPVFLRRLYARLARARSRRGKARKDLHIMDVNPATVRDTMARHGTARLIHGHTHRPATHTVQLATGSGERIVLADWQANRGEVLVCDAGGCRRETLL